MEAMNSICDTVVELIRRAETQLPEDIEYALKHAITSERYEIARKQIRNILENVKIARENSIPLCQDTGILKFYLYVGEGCDFRIDDIRSGIIKGTMQAMDKVPLRPNMIDPITRETKERCGVSSLVPLALISEEILAGKDYLELVVIPKGAGSENMSRVKMLNPSDGVDGIKRFVINAVREAGGCPCPPTILGVGIGGSIEDATVLAKKSLLRRIDEENPREDIAKLEMEILDEVNRLGIGPMGLGGDSTCIGVNIEIMGCHTASLPIALNIQCWANRRAKVRIYKKGYSRRIEFL